MVLLWLQAMYGYINQQAGTSYTIAIERAIRAANKFLQQLYRGGLWLSNVEARMAISHGRAFCAAYLDAARHAYEAKRLRFKISPKFHAYCHFMFDLQRQIHNEWVLSPLLGSCQQDEDFVCKVSALTVCGSFKLVHLQSVQRYLLNLRELW